jgi:DNA-binding NtrC family response regulator
MMPADSCSVLLVDDEAAFIEPLMKRLKKRGLTAVGCNSGEAALRHLAGEPVDVVVLDVKMPGLGGIETLRQIKKEHPLVEVIMMTGHASVEVAIEGMELGAFDYLMKPTDFDDLLFKIQDARQKKAIQEAKIERMR